MDEHLGRNNNRLLASEAHNAVKTEINLPKIFTTKRGALMLFSGHNQSNDKSQRHIKKMLNKKPEEQPTTTLNDLSRNILFYGIEKRMVSFPVDHQNDFHKAKSAPIIADDTVLFSVVSRSTKSLMNNEIEAMDAKLTMSADSEQQQEIRPPPSRRVLKRIHRGLSARRYLRDLTKNWDQTLLDSFIRDRKLNQEEKQPTPSNDLSLSLPPLAYRFDQSWISAAVDMRSYKFVRAQDFDLNQNHNSQPQKSPIDEMDLDEKEEEKEAPEIKILDNNQSEVNYETLDKEEKEKVLTELLFNGALNKIKSEKNVVFYDENLNYSNEEVDENTKPLEKNSDFDLISGENSLKKDVIVESPKTTVGKSTLTIPEYHNEPNYMFGKHSASPLITNIKQTKQPNVIVPESQRVSQRDKSSRLKQNQNLVEVVDIKTLPISPQESNLGEHEEIKTVPLNVDEVKPIVDEKTQDHKDDSSLVTEGNNLIQVEPTQLIQEEKHVEKVELIPLDENNNSDNLIIDNNEYHYVDNCIEEIRSVENEFALIDGEATNEVRNYRLERDKDLDDLIQEEENEHSKVDESAVLNNRDNKEQSQRLKLPRLSSVKKLYVVQKENKDPIENQQQNQLNKDYFKSEKSLMNESVWKNTLDVLKSDQNLYLPIKNNLLKRAKHNLIFLKSNDTVEKTQTSRLPHLNTDRSNYELRTTMQTHRSYDTTTSDRWFEKRLNESENVWRNFNTDLGRVETLKPEIKLHTSETAKGTSEIKPPISQKLAETKSAQAPKLTTRNFENDEMLDNWPKSLDMSGDKLKAKKNVEPESILKPNKLKTVIYESKRKVNWAAGDFDPREFFTQWSYESPPAPIVVDKMYAETLKRYAEYMAKFVLSEKFAGKSLSKDIKRALRTNLVKLKDKIEQGRVGQEILNEYRNIFKKVLTKTLKRRDLEDVRIDDNTLINLLEYPAHAFEIKRDEDDGVEFLRVKSGFLREQAKLIRNVVTERAISTSDFTVEYDPITGEKRFILKSEFAKQLGIPEQAKDMIELYYDENGEQKMRLKDGAKKLNIGDTAFELVQDPNTGAQVLKMVTKQKVGQESFEDILRLAKNMSPESRHRYFQELLKSSGDRMSEEMRRQIIEEMMKNAAENLDESMKEGVLKDLMVNLVNTLPSNLASKVLNDIMKSTDVMDSTIKEKMIKNLMDEFDDLPSNLKNATLKVIVNNLEDLPSQMKQDLLENILTQLENQPPEEDNKLRNQVLTEMLKNSQNFDAQTRNKILQNVFDRIAESTEGDEQKQLPSVVLEELVKQMYTLPEEMKARIVDEINRGLEHGELGPNVLGELLKNAQDLAPDLLENMIKNIDKMGSESIKELVKNLDKIPDELKSEMIENLLLNANNQTDENVKYELLEELLKNPELIQDEEKREQVLKEMVGHLTGDSILKHTENMSSEERAAFVQDLLKKAGGDLSEEARGKLVEMLVKDAKEAGGEGLTNLVNNLLKDLDPQSAGKLVNELMKNADGLDVDAKQRMIENLMGSLDNEGMSDQAKSYAYEELLKNLDGLNSSKKEEIMNQILNKVGDMSSDSCDQTIKALMDNLNDLSADQKNNLLQTLLNKMDDGSSGKNNAKSKADELKNEVIREILKNSKNLNEQQRGRILQEVLEKARLGGESDGQVSDVIMQELVSQMDSLPDTVKQTVLNEVKKDLARGRLGARTMKNLLKNAANVPKELLEQVVDNMKELPTETLQELTKNLDSLPTKLKDKAVRDLVTNLKDLDAKIKKQLLNEIATKPHLIKDKKLFETAIKDMVGSLKKLPEAEKKDMLKSLAKNINNLSQETKEKVMKEMFDNLENGDEDVRESILTQLVHKMGEADLETWIKCSDMADDLKEKMLQDIRKLMDEGNTLLDSDDEQQLVGLTGRQREIKKRQLIEKKKPATEEAPIEKPGLPKFTGVKKTFNWLDENREEIFELANSNQDEPIKLNQDQIEYFQAFSKLTKDEKAKIMETMTDEEKENFKDLQAEYERLRQLEIEAALAEARRLAIEKLRLKLEHEKKMAYLRMMRLEAKMFERSQQISRAFVYSYYDVIAWLNPNDSQALTKQLINSI